MRIDWVDILAPPVLALLVLLLSWGSARSINGGRPLSQAQKKIVTYAGLFALGMLYVMVLGKLLPWRWVWIPLAIGWAGFLTWIAWRRHRQARAASPRATSRAQKVSNLRQGFAVVALLISLVMSSVEWNFVVERQGHLPASLFWSAGVVGSILLAYGNRRAIVLVALRAYLALLVIGAIAQRSLAAVAVAAIAGAVLFVLQKFWKPPEPPILDLETLEQQALQGRESASGPKPR